MRLSGLINKLNPKFDKEDLQNYLNLTEEGNGNKLPASQFKNQCIDHALTHNNPIDSEKRIILVHPFEYLSLKKLTGNQTSHVEQYKKKLLSLIRKASNKVNITVLEHPGTYALASASLLEKKIINDAYISRFENGKYINHLSFNNQALYFAGLYNNDSLSSIITMMLHKEFYVITDIVLNSPYKSERLKPGKNIYTTNITEKGHRIKIPKKKCISYEQAIKALNI